MDARSRWFPLFALLMTLAAPLVAQNLTLEARFEPATAAPGAEVELVLAAKVAPGWHAYGTKETTNIPIGLKPKNVQPTGLELVGDAVVPPGNRKSVLGVETFPLPNKFEVRQRCRVVAGFAGTEASVTGQLDYQLCDANMCLAPSKASFAAKLAIVGGGAASQEPKAAPSKVVAADGKLSLGVSVTPSPARPGEQVTLVLDVVVDEAWHAYGTKETTNIPVALTDEKLQLGGLKSAGDAVVPPGERKEAFGAETFPLPPTFRVTKPLLVPSDAKAGEVVIRGTFDYQLCDANSCDPPGEVEFEVKLTMEAGAARAAAGGSEVSPKAREPEPAPTAKAVDSPFESWWALILACIGGGLFALAMPCTYPMIPITFSFFTKQAEKGSGNVMALALAYGIGIVVMFVLVGVLLSSVILTVVNHWITNAVIGVMFFFFAFVLFGWINLNPPQFVQRAAGKASRSGGLLGVFFMGATLVITSFTCTAPIVGSLIANVAKLGTMRVGIGMAIFGLTMAAPFVLLSLMPTKVKAMPRSGEWMETLKVSLGFVELAAAFKFVSMVDFAFGWQILPRELFLLLWTAIFGLWAMYLFGILRKAGTVNEGVSAGRMAGGMAVTLLATYFLFGALGYRLDFYMTNFVPGYSAESVLSRSEGGSGGQKGAHGVVGKHRIVLDDGVRAVEVARVDDKLLLYNFTGFN
jgi:cytochrome c biogenesis protein CcdA